MHTFTIEPLVETKLIEFIKAEMQTDPAHDLNHVFRVLSSAKKIGAQEGCNKHILIPAVFLHDCFTFPKNHPDRKQSSRFAADKAVSFLKSIDYPEQYLAGIHHAILTHSYSAGIKPESIEAQVLQDADRLDALGAVGIARCVMVSAKLERELYQNSDPFCQNRAPNDAIYTIDHFYNKLFKISETMNTNAARIEAQQRKSFMQSYLQQLQAEL